MASPPTTRRPSADAAKADKLFLVDAMSLVFRAFFAPMQTALVSPTGVPTKAVYIFVRTLRKILKDHQPTHIAVVFDLAAPTFRTSGACRRITSANTSGSLPSRWKTPTPSSSASI